MPKLKLPEKERPPGLYIYCNNCEKYYRNDKAVSCSCESIVYKAKIHIPGKGKASRTRSFSCTTFDDALKSYRDFKKELEKNSFLKIDVPATVHKNNSLMYTDCIEEFMCYLRNENVPYHARVERTEKGIKSYERSLNYFGFALIDHSINPNNLHFENITEEMVGYFVKYLENKTDSGKTFNGHVSELRAFSSYIITKHKLKCKNYFNDIQLQDTNTDNPIVAIEEFNAVLKVVNPDNSWVVEKSGKRTNYYRHWMIDAFRLGLYTGGRREEVVKLKWSGIKLNKKGKISYIETEHYKINRAKKKKIVGKKLVKKKFALNYDLHKLLYDLGYDKYKGTDHYILAPEETASRKYMMKLISLAFTEYFKQINAEELKQFKHLRKTYATTMYLKLGDKLKDDTAHTTMSVLHKYYINEAAVAEKLTEDYMSWGSIFS